MKELLRSHSVSYLQGFQIALEGQGIKAVILDEQAPGYMGFAGRARLAVAEDEDFQRAIGIVRALEKSATDGRTPPSWALQRWGVLAGAIGFALLIIPGILWGRAPFARA